MKYKNPIIFSDYSDPDVLEYGDKFIMTASSFNYIPGLPILLSEDLVNWKLVNYAIENRLDFPKYNKPMYSNGVWAPSIRKHNSLFYIFFGMPDEGIFEVHTSDPLKKWSTPHLVKKGKGLIDPCPFWEDNKAYVVHAYAKSRIGFKSVLGIFEIDPKTNESISTDSLLYNGITENPTIEGPKVYKKNNYYYIFAPAGGVKYGWQTVLRSKSLFGPFETKKVLEQKNTTVNGPHQGAMIKDKSNNYWFIHFQDKGIYGRITHLQPLKWKEDWPVIANNGKPLYQSEAPYPSTKSQMKLNQNDMLNSKDLSLYWQWSANKNTKFYSTTPNGLYLNSHYEENGNYNLKLYPNLLSQKLIYRSFKIEVTCDYSLLKENEEAGLAFIDRTNIAIAIRNENNRFKVCLRNEEKTKILDEYKKMDSLVQLSLILKENSNKIKCGLKINNKSTKQDITFLKESIVSWSGLKVAIYSISKNRKKEYGKVRFSNFKILER
ncbi:MAG: family 43 glycosylhydrolase [Sphaerochaetaceae bacterium]|nr:family 43 glycosylhydrolase [Sphaerochaetaceae bacterium]MDC7237638.1 family 43 glycosylhydrolase [Sphaerochaetaceae bacterium]